MDENTCVYCKNCVYAASSLSNICFIPTLNVYNYLNNEQDILERLRIAEKTYEEVNKNKTILDFSTYLFVQNQENPTIENHLLYEFHRYLKYSEYKNILYEVQDFTKVYGNNKEELISSIFERSTLSGQPTLLNKNNNCPFFKNKTSFYVGLNGNMGVNKNQQKTIVLSKTEKLVGVNKLKLLVTFFVSMALLLMLIKILLL
jgi:hypothetical protein